MTLVCGVIRNTATDSSRITGMNTSIHPDTRPGFMSGSVMRPNVPTCPAPRMRDARSRSGLMVLMMAPPCE